MKRKMALLAALVLLSACKPSDYFRPYEEEEPSVCCALPDETSNQFAAGTWIDDYGVAWDVRVDGDKVEGFATTPEIAGARLYGFTDAGRLSYQITGPDASFLGFGLAIVMDAEHAQYVTYNPDGSLNSAGQLHFNHAPGAAPGTPMDLRPDEDSAVGETAEAAAEAADPLPDDGLEGGAPPTETQDAALVDQ